MKKIIFSLILIFCLTGCWNYKELNDYSIISGIAIDKNNDEYEISILISNSPKNNNERGTSESNVVVYSGKGNSIVSASKDIGLISPKEIYFGTFSVVVLSEEVAKDGLKNVLDFFLRYSNTGKNFYIVISKDCKAKDTLKVKTPLANFPSQNITDNLTSTTKLQGIIAKTNFNDLLSIILRKGVNPTINTIKIIGDIDEGEENKNLEYSEPKTYTKLDTLAIFRDDKLVDYTTREESLGINIINNKIDEMYLDIETDNGYLVIDTTKFKSSKEIILNKNKPIVNLEFNGEARIIEVNEDLNLENQKNIDKLQKKTCDKIINFAKKAINKAIDKKTDIFGFGLEFYRKYPKYFDEVKYNWDDNLNSIEINMTCNMILKNKMTAKNSLEDIYNEKETN